MAAVMELLQLTVLILLPISNTIITSQPNDVYTYPGRTAIFPCQSNTTTRIPDWNISGIIYNRRHLPQQYNYLNKELVYNNVSSNSNGTTFQCIFYAPKEQSEVASLVIIPGIEDGIVQVVASVNCFSFFLFDNLTVPIDNIGVDISISSGLLATSSFNASNLTLCPELDQASLSQDCLVLQIRLEVSFFQTEYSLQLVKYASWSNTSGLEVCLKSAYCCQTSETTSAQTSSEPTSSPTQAAEQYLYLLEILTPAILGLALIILLWCIFSPIVARTCHPHLYNRVNS